MGDIPSKYFKNRLVEPQRQAHVPNARWISLQDKWRVSPLGQIVMPLAFGEAQIKIGERRSCPHEPAFKMFVRLNGRLTNMLPVNECL